MGTIAYHVAHIRISLVFHFFAAFDILLFYGYTSNTNRGTGRNF